jgi:MFS family permease
VLTKRVATVRGFYGWRILAVLSATSILVQGGTFLLFPLLLIPFQRSFGWSRAEISGAYSLSYVLMGAFALFAGRLVDRSGARILMSVGAAIGCLSLLALTTISAVWQFYVVWGLGIGAVMGLTLNEVPFTAIANWFIQSRGRALAIFSGVGGLSTPILVPLIGLSIARWGWRPAVAGIGAAYGLIMLPAFASVLRRRPEDVGQHPDGEPVARPSVAGDRDPGPGLAFRAALVTPSFWLLTIAASLSNLAFGLVGTHMVAYLIDRGYGGVLAATVVGLIGLISLPARVALSLGTERFGGRRLLALAFFAEGLGIALLILSRSPVWLILFIAVFGIYYGSVGPLRAATIGDEFGRRAFGSIAAAAAFPTYVAIALGAFVAGWLFDLLRSYESTFWVACAACVVGALMVALMPHRERFDTPAPAEATGTAA